MDLAYGIPLAVFAVGVLVLLITFPLWFPPAINMVANSKTFLARPREGYAFEIGNGPFHGFIMNKKGYAFRGDRARENREDWGAGRGGQEIPHEADKWWIEAMGADEEIVDLATALKSVPIIGRSMGGIHWIGFPPSKPITIHQRWVSKLVNIEVGQEKDTYKAEDKMQDDINVQRDNYVLFLNGAEDQDLLPFNVTIIVNTEITNPYLAFVKNNKWLEIVEERLLPEARVLISEHDFKGIIGNDFTKMLEAEMMAFIEGGAREKIEEELGIKIYHVSIARIDPPQEIVDIYEEKKRTIEVANAEAEKAIVLKVQYEREGDAKIMRARKAAEVKELEAQGDVKYGQAVAKMLKSEGDEGRQALILEQLKRGIPGTTFVAQGINSLISLVDPKSAPKKNTEEGNERKN